MNANHLNQLAQEAAEYRRSALVDVFESLMIHAGDVMPKELSEKLNRDTVSWNELFGIKARLRVSRILVDQLVSPNEEHPNKFEYAFKFLVSWLRFVQSSLSRSQTPSLEDQRDPTPEFRSLSEETLFKLKEAIANQEQSVRRISSIVEQWYDHPLLAMAKYRLRDNHIRPKRINKDQVAEKITAEELVTEGLVRVYRSIDGYRGGDFVAWWRKVLTSSLLDILGEPMEEDEENYSRARQEDYDRSFWGRNLSTGAFSEEDWQRIRRWDPGEKSDRAVTVLVGANLIGKVKCEQRHWAEFCDWLPLENVQEFVDSLDDAEDTTARLKVLSKFSGETFRSISRRWERRFTSLEGRIKQTTFGYVHLLTQLDFFGESLGITTSFLGGSRSKKMGGF
jgi:hypothetical protein